MTNSIDNNNSINIDITNFIINSNNIKITINYNSKTIIITINSSITIIRNSIILTTIIISKNITITTIYNSNHTNITTKNSKHTTFITNNGPTAQGTWAQGPKGPGGPVPLARRARWHQVPLVARCTPVLCTGRCTSAQGALSPTGGTFGWVKSMKNNEFKVYR